MLSATEHTMASWDGAELFYRAWQPEKTAGKAVILFHRGHEHSARWQNVIDKLDLPGYSFFAWDARGHGRSPGERGYAEDIAALVKDVDSFVRHVSETYGITQENIVVMAHSVASVLVSAWAHDYAPRIRGLVLGSPALNVRLYVPFAVQGLRLLEKLRGKFFISSYVKGKLLTHDPDWQRSYDEDPLVTRNIAVNILLGLHDTGRRLIDDAGAITLPVLILTSGADFVVSQAAQKRFYDGLPNPRKEMQTFPGFFHDTFNEVDGHLPIAKARMFIEDLFSRPLDCEDLLTADVAGYTHEEYRRLAAPLSQYSPKGLGFAITRGLMKSLGRLSDGIRLGWESGFDSGATLDYVYRNEASGTSRAGAFFDRLYLDSPGWKGIRRRKANLEKALDMVIDKVIAEQKEARIVDIATGCGRYVLESLDRHGGKPVSASLRDFDRNNIAAARQIALAMNLKNVRFAQGDAFDPESVGTISESPNIGIISGLYELFPDNASVLRSLRALSDVLAPDAYLIYTNQPWHPQIEFIARVLDSHRGGKAWVMRRRTQGEMDQLVAAAGFEKIDMRIDDAGIFTVSVARRARDQAQVE